jgi:hypothetical protein
MRVDFVLTKHSIVPDRQVIEIHSGGRMIGTITSDDSPSVMSTPAIRVMSKFDMKCCRVPADQIDVMIVSIDHDPR